MSKIDRLEIPVTIDENGNLELQGWQKDVLNNIQMNWKLIREKDGLTKESENIIWIEYNEDGTFKEKFDEIAVGRSLLMSPFNIFFTWQTTTVTEIIEQREDYIKFKTQNSNYELFRL